MERGGGRRIWIALGLTYLVLAVFFTLFYGGGVGVGALATLELLAMLALAVGVAWASARKHQR